MATRIPDASANLEIAAAAAANFGGMNDLVPGESCSLARHTTIPSRIGENEGWRYHRIRRYCSGLHGAYLKLSLPAPLKNRLKRAALSIPPRLWSRRVFFCPPLGQQEGIDNGRKQHQP